MPGHITQMIKHVNRLQLHIQVALFMQNVVNVAAIVRYQIA